MAPSSSKPSQKDQRILARLRPWNMAMGGLHLIQGSIMWVFSNEFSVPVTTAYVQLNASTLRLEPVLQTVTELVIGPLTALFLFLSAAAHFILSLPRVFEWYKRHLGKGINYARWIEYSLSSSLMIVIIAALTGVYDLWLLVSIFFLNVCMILCGLLMERHNQTTKRADWTAFWIGSLAGLIPWIVIAANLVGAGSGDNEVPTFVYWIFFTLFVMFNTFAINMALQYKKIGKWQRYLYGEKVYIVLSLVAKSLLAWQIWFGTLRPV